jgi:hypothetical protein
LIRGRYGLRISIDADVDVTMEQLFNHLLDKATRFTAGGGGGFANDDATQVLGGRG